MNPQLYRHAKGGPPTTRIIEIEALRGVAILMVLVEHMPLNLFVWPSRLYGFTMHYWRGAAGVDLFFAISGFVITRSLAPGLLAAASHRRLRVVCAFWLRRAWRLAPAAWLWVAVPMALSVLLNRSGAFHAPAQDAGPAVAALLNVANLWMAFTLPSHIAGITSPYWSLSLEEQFYLLFPLALLALRQRLIWLMLALLVYQFCLPLGYLANLTRPGAIAAGVTLGLLAQHDGYQAAAPRFMAWRAWPRQPILLCFVLVSGALLGSSFALTNGIKWGLEALLCGAVVFAASFDRGYLIVDGVARRWLVWVGVRSYSLYLTHMPAYAMAREIALRADLTVSGHDVRTGASLVVLALSIAILFATVTYTFVEKPSRAYGARRAASYIAAKV